MRDIIISGMANLRKDQWSYEELTNIRQQLVYPNPEFSKAVKINSPAIRNIKPTISSYKDNDIFLGIPKGFYYNNRHLLMKTPGDQLKEYNQVIRTAPTIFNDGIKLYPYQMEAVNKIAGLTGGTGLLCAPPGSGKTVMGLKLVALKGQRSLVLVHTIDLMKQWVDRANAFLPGTKVGLIGDGKWDEQELTIATIQTLYPFLRDNKDKAKVKAFKKQWGTVVLDEAHHCPAVTFADVIQKFPSAYRFGLTATPERADGLEKMLFHICGKISAEVTYAKLFAEGRIIKPKVRVVQTGFTFYYDSIRDWNPMLKKLTIDESRNKKIVKYIVEEKDKSCLVLSNRIAHLKTLRKMVTEYIPEDKTFLLTSGTKLAKRSEVLQALRDKKLNVVFATQLADEGLDVVNLDRIFLTFPNKFSGKIKQQIGRILRVADKKESAIVYDFADMDVSILKHQFMNRAKHVYRDLKFDIEVIYHNNEEGR